MIVVYKMQQKISIEINLIEHSAIKFPFPIIRTSQDKFECNLFG